MSDINNVSELAKFLGEENVDEIKKVITDELIDNIRESIRYEWLLCPEYISDEFKAIMKEESDKLLKTYKKEIKEALKSKYESWVAELKEKT